MLPASGWAEFPGFSGEVGFPVDDYQQKTSTTLRSIESERTSASEVMGLFSNFESRSRIGTQHVQKECCPSQIGLYTRFVPVSLMQAKTALFALNTAGLIFKAGLFYPKSRIFTQNIFKMRSIALVVPLLWATCSAIPTKSSTLFDYETHYLTDDQSASPVSIKNNTCKVFPGDAEWPSAQDWDRLNQTLNGALIQTVPIAAVCYPELPQYNQERCDYVTNRWDNSTLQYGSMFPDSVSWSKVEKKQRLTRQCP